MLVVPLSKLNNRYTRSWLPRLLIGRLKSIDEVGVNLFFEGQIRNPMRSYSSNWINQSYPINTKSRNLMGSKTFYGDVCIERLLGGGGGSGGGYFGQKSCGKVSVSLRNGGGGSIGCVPVLGLVSRRWDSRVKTRMIDGQCGRRYCGSMSASCSDGGFAADTFNVGDVVVDDSSCKEGDKRTLKLQSGACYLPHPDKAATGGEDAHFICEEKRAIGVADGVGGWADVGVDAGIYSRLLMSNSMAAILDFSQDGGLDPAKVLEKAHAQTNVIGSSTACIIALTDQGIHAINLGDSGFIVIRDGSTVFRSPSQQYGFNFPYQLASGSGGDLPSSGQVFIFPVASGDIIVAGTDGLFDNLYDNEISTLVVQAKRTGLDPHATAQNIAALAQQRALDQQRMTPFAAAAHNAGFRYFGGKLDDITVVVSYITGNE